MVASKSKRLSEGDIWHSRATALPPSLPTAPRTRELAPREAARRPCSGTSHGLARHSLTTRSLAESSQHHDSGICLPLTLDEEIGSGRTGNLSCATSAEEPAFRSHTSLRDAGLLPPLPRSWGLWAGTASTPRGGTSLGGLGREHDTINLEQTFIFCAGLVSPWPWVSGNWT